MKPEFTEKVFKINGYGFAKFTVENKEWHGLGKILIRQP
jgi:hypothetical protein